MQALDFIASNEPNDGKHTNGDRRDCFLHWQDTYCLANLLFMGVVHGKPLRAASSDACRMCETAAAAGLY